MAEDEGTDESMEIEERKKGDKRGDSRKKGGTS